MKKRIISFLLTINLLFLFICGRLFNITSVKTTVSNTPSLRTRLIASERGTIYDRSIRPLVNDSFYNISIVKPTPKACVTVEKYYKDEAIKAPLSKGQLAIFENYKGIDFSSPDFQSIKVFRRYKDNSLCHIIGYVDSEKIGIYGIEKYFNNELREHKKELYLSYSTDALGRVLLNENTEIKVNNYYDKYGIVLTIDKELQNITERALKNGNITKGAAVVMDIKTGEILACASTPTFERANLEKSLRSKDSPFLNRALSQFPVGSIFKIVTSAAAFENSVTLDKFDCIGYISKSGNRFNCSKLKGHGEIDFNTALSFSCNPYFIELGTKVGGERLLNTATELGFGKSIDFGNGYSTDKGTLPALKDLNSDASVGNFAFGQGKLTATPVQIASLLATIGNKGIYNEPKLIKGEVNNSGAFSPLIYNSQKRVLREETCSKIALALRETTTKGTGKAAFTSLLNSATKTATAQSGQYDKEGNEIKYCWFAGFFPIENPQYSVCIMKENGSSGGSDGGPVFKEISENIYIYNKVNQ